MSREVAISLIWVVFLCISKLLPQERIHFEGLHPEPPRKFIRACSRHVWCLKTWLGYENLIKAMFGENVRYDYDFVVNVVTLLDMVVLLGITKLGISRFPLFQTNFILPSAIRVYRRHTNIHECSMNLAFANDF